ncbi:hypothetical protein Herbaro_20145 [Herbaspirillum sp. WKF16]|uniref:hypothetical protein n=1 Tax=Herbaspirillum sp. WKF16 TaxID=3028312 RepID=UPI0023AA1309|nr:hypothetical protein [Herbaspirillum sp. WKF16]WDZ95761.1 hypothetical protein Herbaro_20145 [Herbaspirillum sp. WKF16]
MFIKTLASQTLHKIKRHFGSMVGTSEDEEQLKLERLMNILRQGLDKKSAKASASVANAHLSRNVFIKEVIPRIDTVSRQLQGEANSRYYTFYCGKQSEIDTSHITYNFRAVINSNIPEFVKTPTASDIVFSLSSNGSVVVLLYPHRSEKRDYVRDTCYVVGHHAHASEFLRSNRDDLLRGYFELFFELLSETDPRNQSSPTTARLIKRLEKKTERFEKMFPSRAEQKSAILNAEVGVAMGLVGGLIASTVFPMIETLGKDATARIVDIRKGCETAANKTQCIQTHITPLDNLASEYMTTEAVIIGALLCTAFFAWKLKRILKL